MTNIVNFPQKEKRPSPMPRQRVFYIGYRYVGPMLCQDVQKLYLKRKGIKHGNRWWAIITYGKYDEDDWRKYSLELEECLEDDVPDMLDMFEVGDEVSFAELEDMGWQGEVLYSAKMKSIFHRCYDGLRFPEFASPLKGNQFGTKIMAQGRSAKSFLYGEPLHSYTIYGSADGGWVWMNLESFDGREIKAVPVKLKTNFPKTLEKKLLLQRQS